MTISKPVNGGLKTIRATTQVDIRGANSGVSQKVADLVDACPLLKKPDGESVPSAVWLELFGEASQSAKTGHAPFQGLGTEAPASTCADEKAGSLVNPGTQKPQDTTGNRNVAVLASLALINETTTGRKVNLLDVKAAYLRDAQAHEEGQANDDLIDLGCLLLGRTGRLADLVQSDLAEMFGFAFAQKVRKAPALPFLRLGCWLKFIEQAQFGHGRPRLPMKRTDAVLPHAQMGKAYLCRGSAFGEFYFHNNAQ